MTAFDYFATATATTKRPPAISGGKRGAPSPHLTTPFACTPLLSLDYQTRERLVLGSPMELQQTFVPTDTDIIKGDVLVLPPGGREYPVHFVERWPFRGDFVLQVIVEKVDA